MLMLQKFCLSQLSGADFGKGAEGFMKSLVQRACSVPSTYEPMSVLSWPQQNSAETASIRKYMTRIETQLYLDATIHFVLH